MAVDTDKEKQSRSWELLLVRVREALNRFGKEDYLGHGDYLVVDDNYGRRRVTVEIHNLKMLDPDIVKALRSLLFDLPDWEIVVAVDVPGKKALWPVMGLTIRAHEIVDGLQRRYFPKQFQAITYAGSRPGTGYD